jgi:predicted DNA-binding protein (UPF0251 family)
MSTKKISLRCRQCREPALHRSTVWIWKGGKYAEEKVPLCEACRVANYRDQKDPSRVPGALQNRSMTDAAVEEARMLRAEDPKKWTLAALAERFGVSRATIQRRLIDGYKLKNDARVNSEAHQLWVRKKKAAAKKRSRRKGWPRGPATA